ncbi:MAG: hypothetical protein DGJ47_000827 [Rickettsiaceae bacterium]
MNKILNILSELIAFQSVTPKGKNALQFIANFLKDLGFRCEIKDFGPTGEVSNLYAVFGEKKPNICFAGHVDVVPPLNEKLWKFNPYTMTIDNNYVYGRGVVDMKGGVACALSAVEHIIKSTKQINGSISFLLTTDEEGPGTYGTVKMLEYIKDRYPPIDLCILGEPTSQKEIGDTIKIGRRGSINFDLTVNGKQGHVAYPNEAQNPAPAFISILYELNQLVLDQGTDFFQPSNLEITSIESGSKVSNIIPQAASSKFNIRFNHLHTAEELNSMINKLIAKHSDNYSLSYSCSSLPFMQEISDELQKCLKVVQSTLNIESKFDTNGGTSDSRFIQKYTKVIELGLKHDQAHKINEHCHVSDLQKLYDVYIMLLKGCVF